jgi:hypothetical protein
MGRAKLESKKKARIKGLATSQRMRSLNDAARVVEWQTLGT